MNPLNQQHLTKHHPPRYTSMRGEFLSMTKYVNRADLLISVVADVDISISQIYRISRAQKLTLNLDKTELRLVGKGRISKAFLCFGKAKSVHNLQAFLNSPVQLNTHETPGTKIVLLLQLAISWSILGISLLMRSP